MAPPQEDLQSVFLEVIIEIQKKTIMSTSPNCYHQKQKASRMDIPHGWPWLGARPTVN